MMSSIAERIYAKMNNLIKESDEIHAQINKLQQATGSLKKHIHHTEFEIATEGALTHASGVPDLRLASEVRELIKEKHIGYFNIKSS